MGKGTVKDTIYSYFRKYGTFRNTFYICHPTWGGGGGGNGTRGVHKHFLSAVNGGIRRKCINSYTCDSCNRIAYGTLKVKNCLLNPVCCVTDCIICSTEIFALLECYAG